MGLADLSGVAEWHFRSAVFSIAVVRGKLQRPAVANGERVNPSTKTRAMTVIDYKGYRIEVRPVGKGWRASIFSPGSTYPWPNSPVNLEKSSTDEIVAEAKRIIEVRLRPRPL
jgi:hypothetical protein